MAAAHAQAWQARWQAADVAVEGDPEAQRALRFATYHLISAANPEDPRVSIGARALTGDAYKGHVFWDTEIFMLPFYTFTWPEAARALLHVPPPHPAGRAGEGRRLGYAGALFAWESADTGEEVTPSVVVTPDGEVDRASSRGEQEHHISADVAYAVWQYWQATADDDFLPRGRRGDPAGDGALLGQPRAAWRRTGAPHPRRDRPGRVPRGRGRQRLHQRHGPVEPRARRRRRPGSLAERWPERWSDLRERLELSHEEIRRLAELAQAMRPRPGSEQPGSSSSSRATSAWRTIDLDAYPGRRVPMDVLLGRERTQRSQVVKQADVVLLLYLLWDRFPPPVRDANFRYYEPRTGHGSSLSPAIHALVAARLGDVELAAALLPAGGRDRPGQHHGQRGRRRPHRRAGRPLAGGGVRLRRGALGSRRADP